MRRTTVFLVLLAGCGGSDVVTQATLEARLQPVRSCGELEDAIRAARLREMNETLDANLELALTGGNCYDHEDDRAFGAAPPNAASPAPAAGADTSSSAKGASQVSGTNNQIAGVDEADFVKNDSSHIYVVSAGKLRVIQAWPPTAARELAAVAIEGTPRKLFVANDRALVYSSLAPSAGSSSKGAGSWGGSGGECTYGYGCSFTGDGTPTKITIFDISERSAPRLVRELRLSGSYINARRIGGAIHTVLSSPGVRFPALKTWPVGISRCGTGSLLIRYYVLKAAFDELRAENARIIAETPLASIVPSVSDRLVGAGERSDLLGSCEGFFRPSRADGTAYTTLLSLELGGSAPAAASTIVSRPGAVFASAGALYVAVPHQQGAREDWFWGMPSGQREATTIHKFALEGAGSHYLGSGVVKGRVLNQFAMDEWDGHLRVATTTGHLPSKDVHSTLSVLGQQGGALVTVGVLDRLAPAEDIRSVRFDGERGYVVTFKKTDPLFVFDLANHRAPRVLAELKIPGFSTYMQMMDAEHLLTIGYDANDQGSFAWFTGVMLQIFDVSDPRAPRLAHKEVIGTRGSSSEALTNHLAFTYFAPKQVLALPMTVCEGGSGKGGMYGTTMSFSGLMVYNVTPATGFKLQGKVAHGTAGASCHNWWTNASSTVKRSIIMDDYVFSITETAIKANHLANLPFDIAQIPIDS
jgi:hypothetical protein